MIKNEQKQRPHSLIGVMKGAAATMRDMRRIWHELYDAQRSEFSDEFNRALRDMEARSKGGDNG